MSFVNRFFEDGNINTIIAPPKAGKTNLMVWLGFNAIKHGYRVLGNINMFKPESIPKAIEKGWLRDIKYAEIPEDFKYIPLASQLILEATKGDKNIVVVDEGAISISSSRALTDTVVQFKFLGYSIRKIGACLIIISQSKGSIVPVLRKDLVDYEVNVIKNPDGSRDFEVLKSHRFFNKDKRDYDVAFKPFDYLCNIPYTPIAYDNRHPGGFSWDLDLQELYQTIALSGYDSIEINEKIPDIIKNLVAERRINRFIKE
ncbi:hypothetical protein KA005_81520, partial [bacterium]|nr:hypothetical protein [bacterium]